MKFGTVILCNVTKTMLDKDFQNRSYRDHDVTNYVYFLEKLSDKWLKYVFFLKLTLRPLQKNFKIFFQLLKVKIAYKLNMYRLICQWF